MMFEFSNILGVFLPKVFAKFTRVSFSPFSILLPQSPCSQLHFLDNLLLAKKQKKLRKKTGSVLTGFMPVEYSFKLLIIQLGLYQIHKTALSK